MVVQYNMYYFIGLKDVLRTFNNVKVLYQVRKRAGSDETYAKYFGNGIHEPIFEC